MTSIGNLKERIKVGADSCKEMSSKLWLLEILRKSQ